MPILIDTNFILTCVKQKINLFEQLGERFAGEKIMIPSNVIEELNKLKDSKKLKMSEREAADLALQLIGNAKMIILNLDGDVDCSIINYVLKNKEVIVASLDRGIKKKLKDSRFLTIRQRKKIAEA